MAEEPKGPKNVEDQGTKAEDLQKDIIEGKKTPEVKKAEALAAEEAKKAKDKKEKPPKTAEEIKAAEEEATLGKEVKPAKEEPVDYEQKYKVLQGKYDAEVPGLQEALSGANETIASQNKIIASVQPGKPPGEGEEEKTAEQKAAEEASEAEGKLKVEDFEGYGAEMIEMVNLVKGQAKTIREQDEKLKKIDERQDESEDRDVASAATTFYTDLTKEVEDWRTINKSKEFLGWLAEKDPFTGLTRHTLLEDAHAVLDLDRVAHFFTAFKEDGGKPPVETPSGEEKTEEEKAAEAAEAELAAQVIPDTGGPVTPPGTPQVPKVTRAQLAKATKDYQTGRISEEAFTKIANEFQTAIAAGAPI